MKGNLIFFNDDSTLCFKIILTKDICNYAVELNSAQLQIFFPTMKSLKVLVRNSQIFHGESKNMCI